MIDDLESSCCGFSMTEATRQLVDLEGFRVINKNRYHRVLWERRFMACAIALSLLSIIFFIVSVSTASWAIIDIVPRENHTIRFHLGIWGKQIDRLCLSFIHLQYTTLLTLFQVNTEQILIKRTLTVSILRVLYSILYVYIILFTFIFLVF